MEQNNQNAKEKKKMDKKLANRILYITVAVVICVGAIIGAVVLVNTGDEVVPSDQPVIDVPDDSPAGTTPIDPSTILPEFVSPAVGVLGMKHDMDILVYSKTHDEWRVHKGIDIVANTGDKVMAAADGVVESVTDDPLYGKTVVISHNGNAKSIYSNLSPELAEKVTVGANIKCGELIGTIGDTATLEFAEEPHLHFEMTIDGKPVDPMEYIMDESVSVSGDDNDTSYEG